MDAVGLSVGWQRWTTCGGISPVQASIRGTYPENRTPLSRAGTPRAFSGVVGYRLVGHVSILPGRVGSVRVWAHAPLLIRLQRVCDHCS
jgi:hypothetical protein